MKVINNNTNVDFDQKINIEVTLGEFIWLIGGYGAACTESTMDALEGEFDVGYLQQHLREDEDLFRIGVDIIKSYLPSRYTAKANTFYI